MPPVGYALSPRRTEETAARFRDWIARRGRQTAAAGAVAIGLLLLLRGLLELVL